MAKTDTLTVFSIAIIAYIIQNILHEFGGHGLTSVLVGGEVLSGSTAYLEHDLEDVTLLGKHLVSAAGPLINLLFGGIFWLLLKTRKGDATGMDYFLWISMVVNLLTGTGYFLFSGIAGIGDWDDIIRHFQYYGLWRSGLIVVGFLSYFWAIWLALVTLKPWIGTTVPTRSKLALRLTLFPYLLGSTCATLGALFNPISMLFVFSSAASTFGGTSGLAWMSQLYQTRWFRPEKSQALSIRRNYFWVGLAFILLAFHIGILGRSIKF